MSHCKNVYVCNGHLAFCGRAIYDYVHDLQNITTYGIWDCTLKYVQAPKKQSKLARD